MRFLLKMLEETFVASKIFKWCLKKSEDAAILNRITQFHLILSDEKLLVCCQYQNLNMDVLDLQILPHLIQNYINELNNFCWIFVGPSHWGMENGMLATWVQMDTPEVFCLLIPDWENLSQNEKIHLTMTKFSQFWSQMDFHPRTKTFLEQYKQKELFFRDDDCMQVRVPENGFSLGRSQISSQILIEHLDGLHVPGYSFTTSGERSFEMTTF